MAYSSQSGICFCVGSLHEELLFILYSHAKLTSNYSFMKRKDIFILWKIPDDSCLFS
jgi:hypothetical protein